jgi:hypothetical protein
MPACAISACIVLLLSSAINGAGAHGGLRGEDESCRLCGLFVQSIQPANFMVNATEGFVFLVLKIIVRLKVEPKLGARAEIFGETQCGIGSNSSLAMYNFVDSAGRDFDIL